jgi:imidazolonepropionase
MHDAVWLNANVATMRPDSPYGAIEDGVIAVSGGRISFVGRRSTWKQSARTEHDARGAWITPGLVDCHTHLVYAGNRAHEFELRLKGASYEDIARAGGGIVSTVRSTRAASHEELLRISGKRLSRWLGRVPASSRSSRATDSIATPSSRCCAWRARSAVPSR